MTAEEEAFLHFESSVGDLNEALTILEAVKGSGPGIVKTAAFRFAIVKYAAPYKASQVAPGRRLSLPETFVPASHLLLHQKLVAARDQIHSHSDLTVKDIVLHVREIGGQKFPFPIQNVITGAEALPEIDEIIYLIRATLDQMLPELVRLTDALPTSSD